MMHGIIGWVLRNKSVSVLATVLLIAAGAYGATQLKQELLPELDLPLIIVNTQVPGASTESVDETVTEPIETAVSGVEGMNNVSGTSSQGISAIQVEFEYGTDLDAAETEIRSAINGVSLPDQATDPEIAQAANDAFPIQVVSVSTDDGNNGEEEDLGSYSDDDLRGLTEYVNEEVVPELEDAEGVGDVSVVGGSETVAGVELDTGRMLEANVSAQSVLGAINGAEVNSPVGSGRVEGEDRSTPINARGDISSIDSLRELPVTTSGSPGGSSGEAPAAPSAASASAVATAQQPSTPAPTPEETEAPEPVPLEDVADVGEQDSKFSGEARADGAPSLALSISRDSGANTVDVAEAVDAKLAGIRDDMGSDDQVTVISNEADSITTSVNDTIYKGLIGLVAAVAVILLFLRRWRATLVAAISLPTSVAAALLFAWSADLTLNLMTLGGLVIAIGRVVDDAIVVLENSDRYLKRGHDPDEAALLGTVEVASPITSSTLCTVAVFLPLAFIGGIIGQVFTQLALTVAFALLASLVVAVTIIPVLISLFLGRRARRRGASHGGDTEERRAVPEDHDRETALTRMYSPILAWSLRNRGVVLFVGLALFVGGLALATRLPSVFFPSEESSTLSAQVNLPEGTTLDSTGDELRAFEDYLLDDPDVAHYQLQIGGEASTSFSSGPGGGVRPENQADLTIALEEGADASAALDRIENEGEGLYGGPNITMQMVTTSPSSTEIETIITGGTAGERERAAGLVRPGMADNEYVKDVDTSLTGGAPQVAVTIDEERAADAGLTASSAASAISSLFGGASAQAGGTQQATVDGTPIVVGIPEESIDSVEAVRDLPLQGETTVGDIADVEEARSASSITRIDGDEAVTVTGTITSEDTTGVTNAVTASIDDLDLPDSVTASVGGAQDDVSEGFQNLFVAIGVAIALVYLILVAFFGSALTPLVILLSLPLTTSGAFGVLVLTGTPLSIPVLLGILLLVGIVVANAILLVDFAENARKRGATVDEAMTEAGKERLRPILMTAFATIAALVPLAVGIGSGSGIINAALAIPVIGGLITSTLMTLLVVPAGYSLARGARSGARRGRGPDGGSGRGTPDGDDRGPDIEPPTTAVEAPRGRPEEDAGRERELVGAGSGPSATGGSLDGGGESNGGVSGDDRTQFELGRAQGRIEVLEQELRRRDGEIVRIMRGMSGNRPAP